MSEKQHLFSNKDLRKLLIPVILEQLLNSLMGMIDSVMVSNVGPEAISAVSLVDSFNVLVIQAFSALAAGGAIVCSQYIGRGESKRAQEAARQLVFIVTVIACVLMVVCVLVRRPLLSVIFGQVDENVMSASLIYFLFTSLSFPFIALFNAGSSVFRAQKNARTPMVISVISNGMNIIGNGILIWGLHQGVAGAAISTLIARVFCACAVLFCLRSTKQEITVRDYKTIRPDGALIKRILMIGIPSGIENSMFQFGKLAIQSTVSAMGTIAIAAQAMTVIMENLNGIAAIGVGIGLMTVVGQCMGAGRKDEAVYYIKKLTLIGEAAIAISCLVVFVIARPITILGGMEPESARLCITMVTAISIVKPLAWTLGFIPAYGLRAAGDVRFSMIVSTLSMWLLRVTLCIFLARRGMGPMAVWIGMFADWTVRGIIFALRFKSGKWEKHTVI